MDFFSYGVWWEQNLKSLTVQRAIFLLFAGYGLEDDKLWSLASVFDWGQAVSTLFCIMPNEIWIQYNKVYIYFNLTAVDTIDNYSK